MVFIQCSNECFLINRRIFRLPHFNPVPNTEEVHNYVHMTEHTGNCKWCLYRVTMQNAVKLVMQVMVLYMTLPDGVYRLAMIVVCHIQSEWSILNPTIDGFLSVDERCFKSILGLTIARSFMSGFTSAQHASKMSSLNSFIIS